MTNIYLLIYPKLKAFKIGKADNIANRIHNLKKYWGEPKYIDSLYLEIDTKFVFKLEKSLHTLLEQFSMNFSEGDGKSEFFSIEALSDAIDYIKIFIRSNKLSTELVKGIDEPIIKFKRSPQSDLNSSNKRDWYYQRHNSASKRTLSRFKHNLNNLEAVLRVNTLLIKYRDRISYDIVINEEYCFLTLYNRKVIAFILMNHLYFKSQSFPTGFGGFNMFRDMSGTQGSCRLTISLDIFHRNKEYSFFAEQILGSFKLLQKARVKKG